MAAALRAQYGSGWVAHFWRLLFKSASDIMDVFAGQRKRKHFLDSTRNNNIGWQSIPVDSMMIPLDVGSKSFIYE